MFKDTPNASGSENNESSSTAIHSKAFSLDKAISQAQSALLDLQDSQGYWVFELEADCTIPSEYIMMMHYLDDIDENLQNFVQYLLLLNY